MCSDIRCLVNFMTLWPANNHCLTWPCDSYPIKLCDNLNKSVKTAQIEKVMG